MSFVREKFEHSHALHTERLRLDMLQVLEGHLRVETSTLKALHLKSAIGYLQRKSWSAAIKVLEMGKHPASKALQKVRDHLDAERHPWEREHK